ncbi:ornithine cyclodeaminase [Nocardia jiangxiensis]|uniref:Ornithine cyclodeaminase n=1 Tax=Nocardia jiangxiensis TaxID=282685 RepID=A0ABW6S082_9NOCA
MHILTRSDLADLQVSPSDVISAVEDGYLAFARGESRCPTKLMMPLPDERRDSVSYSMLGYDANLEHLGFKTSYRQGSQTNEKYYTTITLYDDATGLPFALMDCQRIGASRTPATTALIARSCAAPGARSALMIGTGVQGVNTLPYLLTVLPDLATIRLFGTHPEGIASSKRTLREHFPDRELEMVEDVREAVAASDIVVVASGRAAHPPIDVQWLPPGGLMISVASKGVAAGAMRDSDYNITTSIGQLGVTGTRLASGGEVRVDAVLPDILAGKSPGRRTPTDRVFAFSSGMIITDIPVAHAFATRAIAAGRGQNVELWT